MKLINYPVVCYLTDDVSTNSLCQRYWATEPTGRWTEKFEELVSASTLSRTTLLALVDASSRAYLLNERCLSCGRPAELRYRRDYHPASGQWASDELRRHNGMCASCAADGIAATERIAAAEGAQQSRRLKELLAPSAAQLPPFQYSSLTFTDAFILYAVLVAANDCWQGDRIGSLASQPGKLAPTPELSEKLYEHLHCKGILHPSPESVPAAFKFDRDNNIESFALGEVDWIIARDASGKPMHQVLADLGTRLRFWAAPGSVQELWYMVAESECEHYFLDQCQRYRFIKHNIYSEKVRETIREYLDILSIGQMWHIIFYTLKDLAALSQDKSYARQHVYNMIPGSIRRIADNSLAHQRAIRPWERRHPATEAWITSIFLDKVLGNGNESFKTATGLSVAEQFEEVSFPDWLLDDSNRAPDDGKG